MKKLLWLEYSVSKQGFLLAGIFYLLFILIAVFDDSAYMFYYLPAILTSLVISRSIIHFSKDSIDKLHLLLPIKISAIVGSKYLLDNIVLLAFSAIVTITHLIMKYTGICSSLNIGLALIGLGIGFFIVNAVLFGYFLFGAENTQSVLIVCLLVILWFSKRLISTSLSIHISILIVVITIIISIAFYIGACLYIAANACGRINIKSVERFRRKNNKGENHK